VTPTPGGPPGVPTIDETGCFVEIDGERWPFEVNLATGEVDLIVDGRPHAVRPLTWREKRTLARYAAAGPTLIDAALVRHRLSGSVRGADDAASAVPGREQRAVAALARWVNGLSPGGTARQLDPVALQAVHVQVLHATGLPAAELEAMAALDVEVMASVADRPESGPTSYPTSDRSPGDGSAPPPSEDDPGLTRIVFLPDPSGDVAEPAPAEDGPASESFDDGTTRGTDRHAEQPARRAPLLRAAPDGDLPFLGAAPVGIAASPRPQPTARTHRGRRTRTDRLPSGATAVDAVMDVASPADRAAHNDAGADEALAHSLAHSPRSTAARPDGPGTTSGASRRSSSGSTSSGSPVATLPVAPVVLARSRLAVSAQPGSFDAFTSPVVSPEGRTATGGAGPDRPGPDPVRGSMAAGPRPSHLRLAGSPPLEPRLSRPELTGSLVTGSYLAESRLTESVLSELAWRLEQAVEDLGLDPED
jgi:hypothetical protein